MEAITASAVTAAERRGGGGEQEGGDEKKVDGWGMQEKPRAERAR